MQTEPPPTYREFTDVTSEALLEVEDGLTKNQRSRLEYSNHRFPSTEAPFFFTSSSFSRGLLWVVSVTSLILACVALAKNNEKKYIYEDGEIFSEEIVVDRTACEGTQLYGDETYAFEGHRYQFVGDPTAGITWREAQQDAAGRCYEGKRGYLASINSEDEQIFALASLHHVKRYTPDSKAWIGATDMNKEGMYSWMQSDGSVTKPFYDTHHKNAYSYVNWAPAEPTPFGQEDCVAMHFDGTWYDEDCYKPLQFFMVEFDTEPKL